MLNAKMCFYFSGPEGCVFFCVAGTARPNCYLALCIIFVASSEMEKWWTHGGMKYVWIYISHIVIFSGKHWNWDTYMQVNYRLAVGLFFMGAYKALRPLLICGLYAEKKQTRLEYFWNFATSIGFEEEGLGRFFLFILSFFIQLHCIVIIVVLC